MKKIVLLNTSILTTYGSFTYSFVTLEEVKKAVQNNENNILSAVGHKSTADVLTSLLDVEIPVNRIQYSQKPEDIVYVFKLNGRPEKGKILSVEEIEEIGYTWGKLVMQD